MRSTRLPSGLAEMLPGPALGAVLASTGLEDVANEDLAEVLVAEERQAAHQAARRYRAIDTLGHACLDAATSARRAAAVGEWAAGEVAATLAISGRGARAQLEFAQVLIHRLPAVFSALWEGRITEYKARIFVSYLADLPPEPLAAICGRLLPKAWASTPGRLRDGLRRERLGLDPDWARRRLAQALRERRVIGYLDENGTMTITCSGLPAEAAARAVERLDRVARAARLAGHPGTVAQIASDLCVASLEARYQHLTELQVVAALIADADPEDVGVPGLGPPATARNHGGQAGQADGSAATRDGRDPPESGGEEPSPPEWVAEGIEIQVGLTTLLGLDERCAVLAGQGTVASDTARAVVANQRRGAQWRFAVLDSDGYMAFGGLTRRRPRRTSATGGRDAEVCRGGVVEMHVGADELNSLLGAAEAGPWARVIEDIHTQYRRFLAESELSQANRHAPDSAVEDDGSRVRFIRGELARHIRMRDRTCVFPGCHRPARDAELDHTREHSRGGDTSAGNGDPLCRLHHRWKTLGWWTLSQPTPGIFQWISPLGRHYRTGGEPIRPPTAPPGTPDTESRRPQRGDGPSFRRPALKRRRSSDPTSANPNDKPP